MVRQCIAAWMLALWTLSWGQAVADEPATDVELPVKKVVLFNSGVGYIEHRAEVTGDAQAVLPLDVDDMNDVLKSLVLDDEGGGHITSVNYASKDPVADRLQEFRVDLSTSPTLAELLQQMRGERVHVSGPRELQGVIVGLEAQSEQHGGQVVDVEMLNVLTDEGLASIPLRSVQHIEVLDKSLNAEMRQALNLIAQRRNETKRNLTLTFSGAARRTVRVGYVRAAPVWKMSYRLVLTGDKQKGRLQGWGLVENTSPLEWNGVQLSLVSGQPIGFQMDLYEPLYVARPELPVPWAGAPRPRLYARGNQPNVPGTTQRPSVTSIIPVVEPAGGRSGRGGTAGAGFGGGGFGGGGPGGATPPSAPLDPTRAVDAQARGQEVAEFFQYEVNQPVTLPSHQSALLPVIEGDVSCERLSIFTGGVEQRHPLHGLKIANQTTNYLAAGPMTVLDQGIYAGDTRLPGLRPGERRLLSYAVDLEVDVDVDNQALPKQLTSAVISAGVLQAHWTESQTTQYRCELRGHGPRQLLIEHPKPKDDWTVVDPKEPVETTKDFLRYRVEVPEGQPTVLRVVEERQVVGTERLASLKREAIDSYLALPKVTDTVRETLTKLRDLHRQIDELQSNKVALLQRRSVIDDDQTRIRANMKELDRTSELYKRYVDTLAQQESELSELLKNRKSNDEQLEKLEAELVSLAPPG